MKKSMVFSLLVGIVSIFGCFFINGNITSAKEVSTGKAGNYKYKYEIIGAGLPTSVGCKSGKDGPNTIYTCPRYIKKSDGTVSKIYISVDHARNSQTKNYFVYSNLMLGLEPTLIKDGSSELNSQSNPSKATSEEESSGNIDDDGKNLNTNCPETSYFGNDVCVEGGSANNAVQNLILVILNWALVGVGTIVVIIVVIGGIRYMTAAGNAETVKSARKMIMNAILALVLYVAMITILNFIIPGGVFYGTN